MSEDTFTTPDGGFGRNAAAPAPPERSLIYRIGRRCRPAIDKFLAVHSEVGDAAVFESRQFPWTAELERRWETVAAEAEQVLRDLNAVPPLHDISPDRRRIAEPDRWRSFFLWGYGYRSEENCRLCLEPDAVRRAHDRA